MSGEDLEASERNQLLPAPTLKNSSRTEEVITVYVLHPIELVKSSMQYLICEL